MGLRPCWDKLSQRRNNRKRRQKKKEEDEVEEAQEKEEEEEEAAETAAAAQSVIKRFKKVLNSLAIWKTQSITALRFHLTTVRVTNIKKATKFWWGYGEREIPFHCWGKCEQVPSVQKSEQTTPKNNKKE